MDNTKFFHTLAWLVVRISAIALIVGMFFLQPSPTIGQDLRLSPQQAIQALDFVNQMGGAIRAIDQQGDYAYIGHGPRLEIINISNPANPIFAGRTAIFPGLVEDVVVNGAYAYVAASGAGLRVMDISNPAAPVEIGAFEEAYAVALDLAGDTIYLAGGGLYAVDVSTPASPTEMDHYTVSGCCRDVDVSGSYAYVASMNSGLRVLDISNPHSLTEVGHYGSTGNAYTVSAAGDIAYLGSSNYPLQFTTINIANPASPIYLGSITLPGWPMDIEIAGNYAYVPDGWGLRAVDVSDPAAPTWAGSYVSLGSAWKIAISGDIAYMADYEQAVMLDLADPNNIALLGLYNPLGPTYGVGIAGDYAYVVDGFKTFRVYDIVNPAIPKEMSQRTGSSTAGDVVIEGGYAYIPEGGSGLRIYQVSDPANPLEMSVFDTPGWANGVAVAGSYAYVADTDALIIINISNPAAPTAAGSFTTPGGRANRIAVAGNYAYLVDSSSGLHILNVSNPLNPTQAGVFSPPGPAFGVDVVGNYAYLVDGDLHILDVTDPSTPNEVGFYPTVSAVDVEVREGYAFIATDSLGLFLIDVSDPVVPVAASYFSSIGRPQDVEVNGNYVYLADAEGGLFTVWFVPPVSASVPITGGSLVSTSDGTSYIFPVGTFTDTVTVTHTVRYPGNFSPPQGLTGIGHFFETHAAFVGTGAPAQPTPGNTYTLTVQYDAGEIGPGIESTLALYSWDGSQWVKETSSQVDLLTHKITASPSHLSLWAVFGEVTTSQLYLPIVKK